jgi:hypothetical protein
MLQKQTNRTAVAVLLAAVSQQVGISKVPDRLRHWFSWLVESTGFPEVSIAPPERFPCIPTSCFERRCSHNPFEFLSMYQGSPFQFQNRPIAHEDPS